MLKYTRLTNLKTPGSVLKLGFKSFISRLKMKPYIPQQQPPQHTHTRLRTQPPPHPVMHQVKVKLQSTVKQQKQTARNIQQVYFSNDIRPDSVLANMSNIPLYDAVCVQESKCSKHSEEWTCTGNKRDTMRSLFIYFQTRTII